MEVEEVEDKDGGLYGLGPEFKIRVFCGEVISLVKEGALTPSGAGGAGGGGGGGGAEEEGGGGAEEGGGGGGGGGRSSSSSWC